MKMTPAMVIIGSLIVFWASLSIVVIMPVAMYEAKPSEIWLPMDEKARRGHDLYVNNGCSY